MGNYIANKDKTHWMISNPVRLTRTGMDGKPFRCPFCPGNEKDTPPETYRLGEGEKDGLRWTVRIVPNKFNIADIHEVIIHSPDHDKNIDELPLSQVELIIKTYKERFNNLKEKGQVFIFCNNSLTSGASLIHPHSQIVVVSADVKTSTLEVQPVVNIVEQNDSFVSYCPDFSEWPYEVWITKNQKSNIKNQKLGFGEINDKEISNLAKILQSSIIKLKKIHASTPQYAKKTFGYNFYIPPFTDWYLRIIPRFMERAGFELSTGIMVNSVEPKQVAEDLKTNK